MDTYVVLQSQGVANTLHTRLTTPLAFNNKDRVLVGITKIIYPVSYSTLSRKDNVTVVYRDGTSISYSLPIAACRYTNELLDILNTFSAKMKRKKRQLQDDIFGEVGFVETPSVITKPPKIPTPQDADDVYKETVPTPAPPKIADEKELDKKAKAPEKPVLQDVSAGQDDIYKQVGFNPAPLKPDEQKALDDALKKQAEVDRKIVAEKIDQDRKSKQKPLPVFEYHTPTIPAVKSQIDSLRQTFIEPQKITVPTDCGFVFKYDKGKIVLNITSTEINRISLDEDLSKFLGFSNFQITDAKTVASRKVNFTAAVSTIRVICNVASYIQAGSSKRNVLQIFSASQDKGAVVEYVPTNVQYVPLISHSIDEINIQLLNQHDTPLSTTWGETTIVLHFKNQDA